MIRWYFLILDFLETIQTKVQGILGSNDPSRTSELKKFLEYDFKLLDETWKQQFPGEYLGSLGRHLSFGQEIDYQDILRIDIPEVAARAANHLKEFDSKRPALRQVAFENLLHGTVVASSLDLYKSRHYREAVLNAIIAVFDLIRSRTKLDLDGDRLISEVLSEQRPRLILDEIDTESGRNDQKGFMQIFKGLYQGVRNPKSHSLEHDLDERKAGQYLVFASLLARRV